MQLKFKKNINTKIIGLTGGICTGKSSVAREFSLLGAKAVDADKISRQVVKSGTPVWKKIVKVFGKTILNASGTINRQKLAKLIFSNKAHRQALEKITHPAIIREINNKVKALMKRYKSSIIIIDAPLLFEAGLNNCMDENIVVWVNQRVQLERLIERDKTGMKEAKLKLQAQMPLNKKKALADYVIDNSRSFDKTKPQIKKMWKLLTKGLK